METAVNKTNTRKPPAYLNALVFLSVLLIGADTWGVNIGGFNFRFVQVILLAAGFVVLVKNQYKFYFSPVLMPVFGFGNGEFNLFRMAFVQRFYYTVFVCFLRLFLRNPKFHEDFKTDVLRSDRVACFAVFFRTYCRI